MSKSFVLSLSKDTSTPWIPAFAGMTEVSEEGTYCYGTGDSA